MKKFLILIMIGTVIYSCGNNKADQPIVEEDTSNATSNLSHWEAESNDSTGLLELKKIDSSGPDTLSVPAVLDFINKSDSSIHLDFIKVSHDTLYLKIQDATHLTQQMGTTGPTLYLAAVVYNLTEIPGITKVNIDFEEGDHAAPDVWDRNSFKDK